MPRHSQPTAAGCQDARAELGGAGCPAAQPGHDSNSLNSAFKHAKDFTSDVSVDWFPQVHQLLHLLKPRIRHLFFLPSVRKLQFVPVHRYQTEVSIAACPSD